MDWSLYIFKMNDQKAKWHKAQKGWETTVIMKAISLLSLREQDACCQLNIKLLGSWGQCVRGQEQSGELAAVILFPASQRDSGAGADGRRASLSGQARLTCLPEQRRGYVLVSWNLLQTALLKRFFWNCLQLSPHGWISGFSKSQNIKMPLSLMKWGFDNVNEIGSVWWIEMDVFQNMRFGSLISTLKR